MPWQQILMISQSKMLKLHLKLSMCVESWNKKPTLRVRLLLQTRHCRGTLLHRHKTSAGKKIRELTLLSIL
jgi:hypothetical protein